MATPTTIDVHAHFFPENYLKVIEEAGGAFGARVDRSTPKGPAIVVRESRTPALDASYWDLDLRRKAMNAARTVAKKPFRAYLRRFTYDTISHAPEELADLIGLAAPTASCSAATTASTWATRGRATWSRRS
ncbi:MAG: hypothetical protein HYU41_16825 [Candidatus Rokubacteria bacterium]|nr:hypothetical protein [Candidatus Rokubacteria bacterium]